MNLICKSGEADAGTKEFVAAYTAACEKFLKKSCGGAARISSCKNVAAGRQMTQLYLDRATKFEYEKLTPDWNVLGVEIEMKRKIPILFVCALGECSPLVSRRQTGVHQKI